MADDRREVTSAASWPGHGETPLPAAGGAMSGGGLGDFTEFFATHHDAIHRFLWRLTKNAADADDLLQETFLTAWRKRGQFEARGSAAGWLRRTAFRLYLNQRHKSKRRAGLADPRTLARPGSVPPEQRQVDERESAAFLLARVESAVDELPDEPREVFVLFRYEGLTCAEIAEATDAPVKTVETRLRRATQILQERLRRFRDELPGSVR